MKPGTPTHRFAVITRKALTQLICSVATTVIATSVISHTHLAASAGPAKAALRVELPEAFTVEDARAASLQEQFALAHLTPVYPAAVPDAVRKSPEPPRAVKKAAQSTPAPAPRPKDTVAQAPVGAPQPDQTAPPAPEAFSIRDRITGAPDALWTEISKIPQRLNEATSHVPFVSGLVTRVSSAD